MHPKRISKWVVKPFVYLMGSNNIQRAWLFEPNSITERIKRNHSFELELVSEHIEELDYLDKRIVGIAKNESTVRRVKLFGDRKELVFGESIIPQETKEHGFAGLKNLGSKPLGDLIFTSKRFKKMRVLFAKFEFNNNKYWGRITVFRVNGYPMSIKEIFIID